MRLNGWKRQPTGKIILIILAACLAGIVFVSGMHLFARLYGLLFPVDLRNHGYFDEFLAAILVPALGFAAFTLFRWRELQREVSRRKLAEYALQESEERFRLVFDRSTEGIVIAEYETGSIIYANATMETLLGYSATELLDQGMRLLFSHFRHENLEVIFSEISRSEDFMSTRIKTARVDGKEIIVSLRVRFIKISGNNLVYLSLRDMSEKCRLEAETRLSQAKLIQANKMGSLGMLVSGMAHEINNPNNYIMFNSSLLAGIWHDAKPLLSDYYRHNGDFSLGGLPYPDVETAAAKLIDGIGEGSTRIKNIVDDLKNFARQETSGRDDNVDVNQAVLKSVAILTPQIKKFTTSFQLHLTEQNPCVSGNLQQLEQVIMNLLINALQALAGKGAGVSISTADTGRGTVTITIRDDGTGMDGETVNQLSEPFFTTKSDSGGLGLGLFISQSIIRDHHGTLRFESAPGAGTTAVIELPSRAVQEGTQ